MNITRGVMNSDSHFVEAFQWAKDVTDNSKLTDNTPSNSQTLGWELERTFTTVTPAANQFIIIDSVAGDVALNGTAGDIQGIPATVTGDLGVRVGGSGEPVGLVSQEIISHGPVVVQNNCTNNVFTSGLQRPLFKGALGQAVTIQFYLSFSTVGPSTCSALCLRNTVVNYRLVQPSRTIPA